MKAMKELGYVADNRQNAFVETKVFGLLMESLSEASRSEGFYTRVVSGIEDIAYELGYQVLLHVYRPEIDPVNSLRELMGRDIAGLIIANDGDVTPEVIRSIKDAGVPMVLIENYQSFPIHSLTADNFTAGRVMTEYLIKLGHRRIGGIGGPSKYSSLRDRMRGHQIALIEHGIPSDPSLQPPPVSGNPRKGYVQMQQLLSLPQPPTAVFAVSDRAAIGAMDAIKDAGLSIPDDISVVGVDDVRDSAYSTPPLTTFSVPKYDLGRTAVFILHDLISGKTIPPCRTVLLGKIVERQSAGAPRKKE
jgi:LacI family transcriptional regulator